MRLRRTLLALLVACLTVAGTHIASGATTIHLPFPSGTAISILQGYYGGTHQGVERFSLDLTRDDGKTSGSPALAPAAGVVVWSYPPGANTGCIGIIIDGGNGLHEMLCHLILNHDYANGEHVAAAQVLGTVGAPGTVGNNGVSHIHLQLYRVVDGARTPVPFATPDGAPLEGVSLPAGDGHFNEWACNSSGPGCHILSQNGAAAPAASGTPRSGTVTSAASGSSGSASLSAPRQQSDPLAIGVAVQVSGTGDCLRVHAQAATTANTVTCLPDGTRSVITDGPQTADGYTWFKLGDLGWSVADYLQSIGSSAAAAPTPPVAATPAPSPVAAAPAPTAPPAPVPSATSPAPELPIGVPFAVDSAVVVTGTGDCLRVHDQPAVAANVLDCLADGTTGVITDGPITADGFTWWKLDARGWVVGDYLQAQPAQ
ncbi:MAG: peptidoglycan DD-metalloendopeptidase family protein [Dehalococcoidia bacterium]